MLPTEVKALEVLHRLLQKPHNLSEIPVRLWRCDVIDNAHFILYIYILILYYVKLYLFIHSYYIIKKYIQKFIYLVLKPKPHHLKPKPNLKNRTAPFIYGLVLVFNFKNRINMVTVRFLGKTAPNRTMLMPMPSKQGPKTSNIWIQNKGYLEDNIKKQIS